MPLDLPKRKSLFFAPYAADHSGVMPHCTIIYCNAQDASLYSEYRRSNNGYDHDPAVRPGFEQAHKLFKKSFASGNVQALAEQTVATSKDFYDKTATRYRERHECG